MTGLPTDSTGIEKMANSAPARWASVHGAVFLLAFIGIGSVFPFLTWPWHLVLPLAAHAVLAVLVPALRRTIPRLTMGRLSPAPLVSALLLTVISSTALLSYHIWVRPDVTTLAASLPVRALGNLVVAGIIFSVVNALLEELVFRFVLYEAIAAEWGAAVAIAATAALFGWGHLQGYPPGWLGAVLAGIYGLALGALRWWTGGLGLPIVCHIGADATIFSLMAWDGAYDALFPK